MCLSYGMAGLFYSSPFFVVFDVGWVVVGSEIALALSD